MSEKWNDGQRKVIENTSGNMIVSASAGSGKTATMIERVKRLILEKHVPVSRILMMSFNEAIASEIKEKMAKALVEEVKKSEDKDFLREQIDSLNMSDITTMHAFCNSLIKEYFDLVGVDPAYSIMDDQESKVIINKSINEVFDEYFESNDVDFILLKDKLSASNDDNLRTIVEEIFNYSNSLPNGEEWLDNAVRSNYDITLEKTKPAKYLVSELITKVNNAIDNIEMAMNVLDTDKYTELAEMLNHIKAYASEEDILKYEKLLLKHIDFPRRVIKDDADKAYYAKAKSTYQDVIHMVENLFPVSFDRMREDHASDGIIMRKLVEIVKRFRTYYNREKAEVNKLDFNDMEHYALEILSHEDIRNDIKSKYDYVCVDEYQDINAVQDKLIDYVSRGDNLLMVGDPKQSIYKFRFTEPEIFISKLENYRDSQVNHVVELDNNYRSSPLILEDVNNVFDILMKNFRAGKIRNVYSSLKNGLDFEDKIERPFEVMLYEVPSKKKDVISKPSTYRVSEVVGEEETKQDAIIEAEYIAGKVDSLLHQEIYDVKLGEYRLVKFEDMAILAQSRTPQVKMTLDILESKYHLPIDATYLKKKDEPQEVKILLDFLRCIDNPRQDIVLYTVMKLFFDFTDDEFVEMKKNYPYAKNFHNIVFDSTLNNGVLATKVSEFISQFNEYRFISTFMNVHDFLLTTIEKTGFVRKLLMTHDGKISVDNIDKFLGTLKDKRHSSTIQEFLYAYDNYNITNDVEATSQSVKSSIHTSTIHQSKGLEYPIVFLINAGNPFLSSHMAKSQILLDKDIGIAVRTFDEKNKTVYSNWLINAIKMKKAREEVEEKFRLLYVAMTRAKNCLYIVGKSAKKKNDIDSTTKYTDILWSIAESNSEFNKYVDYREANKEDDPLDIHKVSTMRAFDYEPYDENEKKSYEDTFSYEYPYEVATHLAQKYTVTSINHEEREKEEYVPELYETEKTSIGSIYHKFMECVNYEAGTYEAIREEMSRMVRENILSEEEIECINIEDVYKCLNSTIIKIAKVNKHDREKKFMMCLPMSEVKDGASDEKVIIQGIADLVIYGKENILVDFKKSSLPDDMLRESYQKQLDLYKFALEKSMNIKFQHTYLYVIGRDRLIDMD